MFAWFRAHSHAAQPISQVENQERLDDATQNLVAERDFLKCELASLKEHHARCESARFAALSELLTLRRELAARGTISKFACPVADLPSFESAEMASDLILTDSDDLPSVQCEFDKRALLMMRNPLQLNRAVAAMATDGYAVDVVSNGPGTYYSVMMNDYSLIVVDIDLPDDEGFDALEALRLLPTDRVAQSNCLFALTATLTPDRVLRCTDLGVDGMFVKPLTAESLRRTGPQTSQATTAAAAYA